MKINTPPIPQNEMERLLALSEFDLDYSSLQETFKDLTKLASKVAGTSISLINFIDSFNQWTVASHNLPLEQMGRDESVCQYTIMQDESFEVNDLLSDDRFNHKFYVAGEPNLRYYFGVPLVADDGLNVGALCVLDTKKRYISPEKVELLKIIADEIMNRITAQKIIGSLKDSVKEANKAKLSVAHDIRGPLSGIMSLAEIVGQQGDKNKIEDVLQFVKLIYKSSHSLLELAEEILNNEQKNDRQLTCNEINLVVLKQKLEKLYTPQALNKKINFVVNIYGDNGSSPFNKNKLLQIIGNLISNAIKFTPANGEVEVALQLLTSENKTSVLNITVRDSGVGIDSSMIKNILDGNAKPTDGTLGEQGYGFGLALVKHLIDSLQGSIKIQSTPNAGTVFTVDLPQKV